MALPKFQSVMLPTLQVLSDGRSWPTAELNKALADHFKLTDDDIKQKMTSGQTLFYNRAAWAKLHLKKAGLIEYPERSVTRITDLGQKLLKSKPQDLKLKDLAKFPLYSEWRKQRNEDENVGGGLAEDSEEKGTTPAEQLSHAFNQIQNALAGEIVDRIHAVSPSFFEKLVLDVLIAMGYGGSFNDAQEHVGRSGDGGIDGIIREDRLGLDMIFIQAKRWEKTVGRPEIQQFVGALHERRARKGVFITTSTFSRDARDYVVGLDLRVSLIDGRTLASLMIEHDVGVSLERVLSLKRLDSDYFEEE